MTPAVVAALDESLAHAALAYGIVRTALDDLAPLPPEPARPTGRIPPTHPWWRWHRRERARADARDFLTRRLWEPGCLWTEWAATLDRALVLREVRFRLGETTRCPACDGRGRVSLRERGWPDAGARCARCGGRGELVTPPPEG